MGEMNNPVNAEEVFAGVQEVLAKYLYDNYEQYKHNKIDSDVLGDDPEPWESAGKRMREKWFLEAERMLEYFRDLMMQ